MEQKSLAPNLVSKLPPLPNILIVSKVEYYYGNKAVSKDLSFPLLETSLEKKLKYFEKFKLI